MKRIIVFIILLFVFAFPINADSIYDTQYENIGADSIENGIDKQTLDFMQDNGIDAKNPGWVNNMTVSNVFSHIGQFVKNGAKTTVKSGVLIASVIFLAAALTAFGTVPHFETAIYAATLTIGAVISGSIWQSISSAINALKGCSMFMTAFVPIFASVMALSGKTVTAPAMSALLLGAAEIVSVISSFTVLPLIGGYLALSVSSGVSPLINGAGIADSVKKISVWIISLFSTVFVGILGIQTAVNSAADSVTMRTAKFILGTSVPIAGSALGEAAATISASVGLLRSSIGMYGVVALVFILLPIIIELVLWRLVLMLNITLSETFSLPKITGILKSVDSMLALLIGIIMMIGGMFIISLTVVVTAGKA
ncbi:MAG: hypothetical protein IJE02_05335 [Clostridia bacterium]|nr:hypothetical protein [Clostridia bacterium]